MKRINRARVLNAIRENRPVARSKLADITGLDRKSITNFVAEFLDEGLVEEVGTEPQPHGRPLTLLEFREVAAVGIDIGPTAASGVATDLYGRVIASHRIEYPLCAKRAIVLEAVERVYERLRAGRRRALGTGIVALGIVDTEKGVVRAAVNVPAVEGMALAELCPGAARGRVFFERSTNAKALAEKWFGQGRDGESFVCIDITVGIGAGIIHGRRLFRGAGHSAGEVGHVLIEPGGRRCRCGKRGCLEAYVFEPALLKDINARGRTAHRRLEEIGRLTPAGERVLQGAAYRMGTGIASLVNILSPTVVVLNGSLMRFADVVLDSVRQGIRDHALSECAERLRVVPSRLEESAALGAATLVLSSLFEVEDHYYV